MYAELSCVTVMIICLKRSYLNELLCFESRRLLLGRMFKHLVESRHIRGPKSELF